MRKLLLVLGVLAAGALGFVGTGGETEASPLNPARIAEQPASAGMVETVQYHAPWRSRRYHAPWRSHGYHSSRRSRGYHSPWRSRDFYHNWRRSRGYRHDPWRSGRWY